MADYLELVGMCEKSKSCLNFILQLSIDNQVECLSRITIMKLVFHCWSQLCTLLVFACEYVILQLRKIEIMSHL